MRFAILAILALAAGCTHTGATKADVKTAQAEAAAAAEKKDEAAKEQDRQKILAMKDITLADLYKLKPEAKGVIEKAAGYRSLMQRAYLSCSTSALKAGGS